MAWINNDYHMNVSIVSHQRQSAAEQSGVVAYPLDVIVSAVSFVLSTLEKGIGAVT